MAPTRLTPPPVAPFSRTTRDERFHTLDAEPFDLIVVGGGITGAGVARDAAMRGLRTVLIEKGDLASGTSSASSKLVHGGLRYLEQRRFDLVFESVSERHRLRRLAPHLVRPQRFVFPVFNRRPRPLWQVDGGLWIYDTLALFRSFRLHKRHSAARAMELEPSLREDGLQGAVSYHDCVTDDARLTLETARAAHDAGAQVITYTAVRTFTLRRGHVTGVEVEDVITGQSKTVAGRVVLNATGPWTDRTRGFRGDRNRMLRPTKGIHVIVSRDRLPLKHAVATARLIGERNLFAIPMGNRVALGTTDTDFKGDFDHVWATAEDVTNLLELANYAFPRSGLAETDVISTYAGLRPLIAAPGASTAVSREHAISVDDDGLVTVAGGKLTTYRAMAGEIVDVVGQRLRSEGVHVGGCPTAAVMLPGGAGIEHDGSRLRTAGPEGRSIDEEAEDRLGADVVEHLQQAHGGRWLDIVQRTVTDPSAARRIVEGLPYLWGEVDLAVETELATTLGDVLRRRTQLQLRDTEQGLGIADSVARRMAPLLGWDEVRIHDELRQYAHDVEATRSWKNERNSLTHG